MQELVNLSNYFLDNNLINNSSENLARLLEDNNLNGLEMLFCNKWDNNLHKKNLIKGVHLKFWPDWLDFWLDNKIALQREYKSLDLVYEIYGGRDKKDWIKKYQDNIYNALETNPEYLVFHVSQARPSEIFNWNFNYTSEVVIENTIKVLNELIEIIPNNTKLLLENLWWPGLTLENKNLVAKLFDEVECNNLGIMLDTGHLMNTNSDLKTEEDGINYILQIIDNLGEYKKYIYGIHLHHSLSGEYVKENCHKEFDEPLSMDIIMKHILKIDEHLPFSNVHVQLLINSIKPEYLVHEFMQSSRNDWINKIRIQRKALGLL